MNSVALKQLLQDVAAGLLPPEEAAQRVGEATARLPFARVDRHRELRCGFPEVIWCEGKTPDQVATLAGAILEDSGRVLMTRAGPEHASAVREVIPDVRHAEAARVLFATQKPPEDLGLVAVISAGTADLPVAEEAAETASALGAQVRTAFDCGVAGLHRVHEEIDLLREANAVVVVAGMEGALPGVVAGLTDRPVIGVPTSVGYGTSFGGVAALLGMLNACASGVTVVNIDNGFGAGYAAAVINRRAASGMAKGGVSDDPK